MEDPRAQLAGRAGRLGVSLTSPRSPLAGDRHVDRADALRRLRGRAAVDAVVPEPRRPGQAGLRGEPADARRRSEPATASPNTVVFHSPSGDVDEEPGGASRRWRGWRRQCPARSRARTSRPATRCTCRRDRHTTFVQVYPPGRAGLDVKSGAAKMRAAAAARASGRDHRQRDGPRPARGGEQRRLERRVERPAGSADRRARRADHPALRLRDAAGGADAARRRDRARS